jgi:hypothetical protein
MNHSHLAKCQFRYAEYFSLKLTEIKSHSQQTDGQHQHPPPLPAPLPQQHFQLPPLHSTQYLQHQQQLQQQQHQHRMEMVELLSSPGLSAELAQLLVSPATSAGQQQPSNLLSDLLLAQHQNGSGGGGGHSFGPPTSTRASLFLLHSPSPPSTHQQHQLLLLEQQRQQYQQQQQQQQQLQAIRTLLDLAQPGQQLQHPPPVFMAQQPPAEPPPPPLLLNGESAQLGLHQQLIQQAISFPISLLFTFPVQLLAAPVPVEQCLSLLQQLLLQVGPLEEAKLTEAVAAVLSSATTSQH